MAEATGDGDLADSFRRRYYLLQQSVETALTTEFGDSVVLERLGDDLANFTAAVQMHGGILDEDERGTLTANLSLLQHELRIAFRQALDASHHGSQHPVTFVHSGDSGRPRAVIDPEWLAWAYQHRSTSAIARYLGLSRPTVRTAIIQQGLSDQGEYPFDLLDQEPEIAQRPVMNEELAPIPEVLLDVTELQEQEPHDNDLPPPLIPFRRHVQIHSYTTRVSQWSDDDLDNALRQIRVHYPDAGISMLHGSLQAMDQNVPRERIRNALIRIDPVHRIFERRTIQRRVYSVPGPNALWHHDGQHGLIRWRIVFHGFVDGYSRLITGLRASNNNRAATVLDVFLDATERYGIPSRVRGDHGTENLRIAAFMEDHRGVHRGSYIWGRSVHNIRIERLWVDLTTSLGAKWAEFFRGLELHHGLDVNSSNHLWLLHYLFLVDINDDVDFFVRTWNRHRIQIRGQPNRSPMDLFGFDMLVHGVRGDTLPRDDLEGQPTAEDLEEYGIDWEAMRRRPFDGLLDTGGQETAWTGRLGPPEQLSEVVVDPPESSVLSEVEMLELYRRVEPFLAASDEDTLTQRWVEGLAYATSVHSQF